MRTKLQRWTLMGLTALLLAAGGLGATGMLGPAEVAAIGKGSSSGNSPPDCDR